VVSLQPHNKQEYVLYCVVRTVAKKQATTSHGKQRSSQSRLLATVAKKKRSGQARCTQLVVLSKTRPYWLPEGTFVD